MTRSEPMRCPECGVEMNLHAEKVDFTAALTDPALVDPDLGGVLEEAHACPVCGKNATRQVRQSQ